MKFREIDLATVPWSDIDSYSDRTFSQRKPWLDFLVSIGAGAPIIARLESGSDELGWFTGLRTRVAGLPVIGSPMRGWNTPFMGLNLKPGVERDAALNALWSFARIRCVYIELSDVVGNCSVRTPAGYSRSVSHGYVSDLTQTEEQLFQGFSGACRRCIRKAEREGVTVEEANQAGFAEEYYSQLQDVFAHQGLRPTYPVSRVKAMIQHVHPDGSLLLLRARDSAGTSIATGIFAAYGRYSTFIGNGSIRSMLHLRPNQALHWYALKRLREKGVHRHDWGGGGAYKEAYGPISASYVTEYRALFPSAVALRAPALRAFRWLRRRSQTTGQ